MAGQGARAYAYACAGLAVAAAIGFYTADYSDWPRYGQNVDVMLRARANNATGGVLCGTKLYTTPRLRNLVYCPAASGIRYVRIQRDTGTVNTYLYVSEMDVFRGGGSCRTGCGGQCLYSSLPATLCVTR